MEKVILNYNPETTELYDNNGYVIGLWVLSPDYYYEEQPQTVESDSLDKLTNLRSMNLSVDEIRDLKDMGLLD